MRYHVPMSPSKSDSLSNAPCHPFYWTYVRLQTTSPGRTLTNSRVSVNGQTKRWQTCSSKERTDGETHVSIIVVGVVWSSACHQFHYFRSCDACSFGGRGGGGSFDGVGEWWSADSASRAPSAAPAQRLAVPNRKRIHSCVLGLNLFLCAERFCSQQ
jgi:hypothetical protein